MKIYRFIGTQSQIGGYPDLTRFGQVIELPEEIAAEAIRGKCPLIPDSDFRQIGFTDKELADHAYVGSHPSADSGFLSKKQRALERLHQIRAGAIKVETVGADVQRDGIKFGGGE